MEKITLYDYLRELVDSGKGEQVYNLFDFNLSMVIVTASAKTMLDTLGFSSFLNRSVHQAFRNNIRLDCGVVIDDTKR